MPASTASTKVEDNSAGPDLEKGSDHTASPGSATPNNKESTSPAPLDRETDVNNFEGRQPTAGPQDPAATGVDPAAPGNPSDSDERDVKGVRWFLVCVAIFSANILYGLDTTIAADIQGAVAETFGDYLELGWLGVGFSLGSVAFILPLGKAYAVFDTKWLFISCLTMFAAGSALCGAAPSMNAIIVGRVWAGAGGAGMYLGNLNLITITTRPKEQPFYIGLIGLIYGTGCILGPIVGGTLSDSRATWRWAFYLNLVIFGVMSPIYLFLLPSLPRRPGTTFKQRLGSMDWVGTVLNAGLYVSFVMIFTFGGTQWAWNDGRIIALFVVFGVLVIAFCVSQYFCIYTTEDDRLFPCEMLKSRSLVLLYVCMACGGAALFVAIYYIPLYFQFVQGDDGTESAVRLLPFVCFYVATILLCGSLMGKTGYYMFWYLASGCFILIGAATMYTVNVTTPIPHIYGYSILMGVGMTTTQAGYAVGPTMVQPQRVAEVIQFMNISQGQSQLLALTIASAIFQSFTFRGLNEVLANSGFSEQEIQGAIAGARSVVLQQAAPDVRAAAVNVIVTSIQKVYIMAIAAGALYIVCSLFLKRERTGHMQKV